ncbi:nucleoside monophosphate kinase [Lentisphaera marina]|uniref:adenylate kinase family protein n=1 Tax=Lentisphaera marina TaxID=1111041 RepID=UPI002365BDAE|nr:nucleoside monophosphate kinase [Lentisphaera marina]MDD7987071.1 nucleoside monophosphate kinase [Lentisphaera marina]
MSKPKAILLFGPPGAGKGTVGAKLTNVSGNYHLSTGDIFRGLPPESPNGKVFYSYANEGKLVPDDVTIEIFWRYMQGLIDTNKFDPSTQYIFLDGMPRTAEQAKILDQYVEVVKIISLKVTNDDEIVERLAKRAKIEKRADDADKSIVLNRLAQYREKTQVVLDHYDDAIISEFDAQKTPLEVFRNVLDGTLEVLNQSPAEA